MNKKKAQRTFIFGCLAPAVILAILFIAVPTITVFKESFFDKTDLIHDGAFVALDNFKVLFSDERFIESMQNIILTITLVTLVTLVLAVLFATLLTREEFRGKNFFRVIFYIPNILSIVVIAGIADISIGETLCDKDNIMPMPTIKIEEPTLSMNFIVNKSPFAGQSGKFVTSRNLKERLEKELEVNVGLKVEPTESGDCFKVSGRGELHISILLENMRREGFEIAVSKPEVIMHRDEENRIVEPVEEVVAIAPSEYSGTIISKLNLRKGVMVDMDEENGYCRITYSAPTRGLLGYRSEFINDTRGEGTLVRRIKGYEPFKGEITQRANGAMISTETGKAMTYALWNLQERGTLFITPQTEVYEGMIIGMSARNTDLEVNPIKNKKLTAIRSSGNDEAMKLTPAKIMSLEEALEFINDDELVEITPDTIRLRKKGLTPFDRKQYYRELVKSQETEQ